MGGMRGRLETGAAACKKMQLAGMQAEGWVESYGPCSQLD